MHYLIFLIPLFFLGCANKTCGIESDIFKNFSQNRQEEICKEYFKLKQLEERRYIISEESRKKELEIELKRLNTLYKVYNIDYPPLVLEISGEVFYKKRVYKLYSYTLTLANKEAKKVCIKKFCFWITYQDENIILNIEPLVSSKERFLASKDSYFTTKESIFVSSKVRYFEARFRHRGALFDLRFRLSYL